MIRWCIIQGADLTSNDKVKAWLNSLSATAYELAPASHLGRTHSAAILAELDATERAVQLADRGGGVSFRCDDKDDTGWRATRSVRPLDFDAERCDADQVLREAHLTFS
jgi:hypothetical protein